jgi:hypothetical protein
VKQTPAARRGIYTIALMPFATWDYEVSIEWMTGTEASATSVYALFTGLFMQTCGGAGFWLLDDVNDDTVTQATSVMLDVTAGSATPMAAVGNGTSKQFQLARTIGNGVDIIQNLQETPTIYVNGVPTTPSSISATGVVTFTSAPANNATLAWAGQFYFLCEFDEDSLAGLALVGFNATNTLHSVTGVKWSSVLQ